MAARVARQEKTKRAKVAFNRRSTMLKIFRIVASTLGPDSIAKTQYFK